MAEIDVQCPVCMKVDSVDVRGSLLYDDGRDNYLTMTCRYCGSTWHTVCHRDDVTLGDNVIREGDYISQMPKEAQAIIRDKLERSYRQLDYLSEDEIEQTISDAMDSRLFDLEDAFEGDGGYMSVRHALRNEGFVVLR